MPLWLALCAVLFAANPKVTTRVAAKAGGSVVSVPQLSVSQLTVTGLFVPSALQPSANPQLLLNAAKPQLLLPQKAQTPRFPAIDQAADPAAKKALIETLSAEAPSLAELSGADLAGAAQSDFLARAQLGGGAKSEGGTAAAADFAGARSGLKKFALFSKDKKSAVERSLPDSGIAEALKRVVKGEKKIVLRGPPTVSDLQLIAKLPRIEVLLTRHRETGQWTLWGGDLHNVNHEADDEEFDRQYHNHPMVRLPYAINTVHPSPEDLIKAEGLDGRFMVISEYGVVEWNSDTGRADQRLMEGFFGRLVMKLTFPSWYPELLRAKDVAFVDKPWNKVTQEWLDHGAPPENQRTLANRQAATKTVLREPLDQTPAPLAPFAGELLQSFKVLGGEEAVEGLARSGRNWYYDVIKEDAEAVAVLKRRLAAANLPLEALENRLKTDAGLLGVKLDRVVSIYRYGSSVWGHKTATPGDVDVLVVVEGEAAKSVKTREAVSIVSDENPRSFLMYMNEGESPIPGALPLNVTVVSREYIADYQARGGQPEEAEALDMGELFGDWGHGALVYGEDALSGLSPRPQHLLVGAAKTERNAGGFMENYIYKIDGRKAQPLTGGPVSRISESENNKLVPKIYLRYVEMSLRLKRALELQGKDEEEIKKLIGDPGARYRNWITGRSHPELPVVTQKLTSEMIGIHNEASRQIERARKADWTPEMLAKERGEFRLRMAALAAAVLGLGALIFLLT